VVKELVVRDLVWVENYSDKWTDFFREIEHFARMVLQNSKTQRESLITSRPWRLRTRKQCVKRWSGDQNIKKKCAQGR
jgi:hypothetical protein